LSLEEARADFFSILRKTELVVSFGTQIMKAKVPPSPRFSSLAPSSPPSPPSLSFLLTQQVGQLMHLIQSKHPAINNKLKTLLEEVDYEEGMLKHRGR
jgi:hypothetical protein